MGSRSTAGSANLRVRTVAREACFLSAAVGDWTPRAAILGRRLRKANGVAPSQQRRYRVLLRSAAVAQCWLHVVGDTPVRVRTALDGITAGYSPRCGVTWMPCHAQLQEPPSSSCATKTILARPTPRSAPVRHDSMRDAHLARNFSGNDALARTGPPRACAAPPWPRSRVVVEHAASPSLTLIPTRRHRRALSSCMPRLPEARNSATLSSHERSIASARRRDRYDELIESVILVAPYCRTTAMRPRVTADHLRWHVVRHPCEGGPP
jgi:hypothetical protein